MFVQGFVYLFIGCLFLFVKAFAFHFGVSLIFIDLYLPHFQCGSLFFGALDK